MISPEKVAEVQRLLRLGTYSHRDIAAMTSVGRSSVGAIALGRRRLKLLNVREPEDDPYLGEPTGPLVRCGGCGGLVYMPCRLCRVRAIKRQERLTVLLAKERKQVALQRRILAIARRAASA